VLLLLDSRKLNELSCKTVGVEYSNTESVGSIISGGSNVYLSIVMGDYDMAKEMTNKY